LSSSGGDDALPGDSLRADSLARTTRALIKIAVILRRIDQPHGPTGPLGEKRPQKKKE
jgi:hypothetical protein